MLILACSPPLPWPDFRADFPSPESAATPSRCVSRATQRAATSARPQPDLKARGTSRMEVHVATSKLFNSGRQLDLRNAWRRHGIRGEHALKLISKIRLGVGRLLMFLHLSQRDGLFGLIKGVLKIFSPG